MTPDDFNRCLDAMEKPYVPGCFWRGLAIGLPVSLVMWAGGVWAWAKFPC